MKSVSRRTSCSRSSLSVKRDPSSCCSSALLPNRMASKPTGREERMGGRGVPRLRRCPFSGPLPSPDGLANFWRTYGALGTAVQVARARTNGRRGGKRRRAAALQGTVARRLGSGSKRFQAPAQTGGPGFLGSERRAANRKNLRGLIDAVETPFRFRNGLHRGEPENFPARRVPRGHGAPPPPFP